MDPRLSARWPHGSPGMGRFGHSAWCESRQRRRHRGIALGNVAHVGCALWPRHVGASTHFGRDHRRHRLLRGVSVADSTRLRNRRFGLRSVRGELGFARREPVHAVNDARACAIPCTRGVPHLPTRRIIGRRPVIPGRLVLALHACTCRWLEDSGRQRRRPRLLGFVGTAAVAHAAAQLFVGRRHRHERRRVRIVHGRRTNRRAVRAIRSHRRLSLGSLR